MLSRLRVFFNDDFNFQRESNQPIDHLFVVWTGHGHQVLGHWATVNHFNAAVTDEVVTFYDVIDLWEVNARRPVDQLTQLNIFDAFVQESSAKKHRCRLIIYIDSCHSGYWVELAEESNLTDVIIQTSSDWDEGSRDHPFLGGYFTQRFLEHQVCNGIVSPLDVLGVMHPEKERKCFLFKQKDFPDTYMTPRLYPDAKTSHSVIYKDDSVTFSEPVLLDSVIRISANSYRISDGDGSPFPTYFSDGNGSPFATDKRPSSVDRNGVWVSQNDQGWSDIDFGTPQLVCGISMGPGKRRQWISKLKIFTSQNRQIWQFQGEVSGIDPIDYVRFESKMGPKIIYLPGGTLVTCRYVKIEVVECNGQMSGTW